VALVVLPGPAARAQGVPEPFDVAGTFAPLGASLPGTNEVVYDAPTTTYRFLYRDTGGTLRTQYEVNAGHEYTRKGLITIREGVTGANLVQVGGTMYTKLDGTELSPWLLAITNNAVTSYSHRLLGNNYVLLSYQESFQGVTTTKDYLYTIKGKTLILRVYSPVPRASARGNYRYLMLGPTGNTPNARILSLPYNLQQPIVVVNNSYFLSQHTDWSRSHSNTLPVNPNWDENPGVNNSIFYGFYADYLADQSGNVPPFDETIYLTLSTNVHDVIMNVNKPPAPFRPFMNDRVTIQMDSLIGWNPLRSLGAFEAARSFLKVFHDTFGLRDLRYILHGADFGGPDNADPTIYPGYAPLGGGEQLRKLGEDAARYGYLVGTYEDYPDMYVSSTYWNPAEIARKPDGSLKDTWHSPLGTVAYRVRPERLPWFAALNAPFIRHDYAFNTSFLDVMLTGSFSSFIDYAWNADPTARTTADVYRRIVETINYLRWTYGGPVEGESTRHPLLPATFYAGEVEFLEREIWQKECSRVIPDFEVKVFRRLTIGEGMGFHQRWRGCNESQDLPFPVTELLGFQGDKYRAMSIAFGHSGFVYDQAFMRGVTPTCDLVNQCTFLDQVMKVILREYFLMKSLQEQYLSADQVSVYYRNAAGAFVELSDALRANLNFTMSQIKEVYDNGLEVYVNWHPTSNWSVGVNGQTYTLPPYGYVAWNPRLPGYNNQGNFLTYSAITSTSGGRRVDYISSARFLMADGRGISTNFGNIQTQYFRSVSSEVDPPLTIAEDSSGKFNNFRWPRTAFGGTDPAFAAPFWRLQGAAVDPDVTGQPTLVEFWLDGPKGVGQFLASGVANDPRWNTGFPGAHGFDIPVPTSVTALYDNRPHTIHGYVHDIDEPTIEIPFTPKFIRVPTTADSTPPTVTLLSPDNHEVNPPAHFFSAYATDNVGLKEATLYISLPSYFAQTPEQRESTWTAVKTVQLAPHKNASILFKLPDLPNAAFFTWNVRVCDYAGNCAYAPVNFGVRTGYSSGVRPSVGLARPVNSEVIRGNRVTCTAQITSGLPLAGAQLEVIVGSQRIPIGWQPLSRKDETVTFTLSNVPYGIYHWNVRACDVLGNCISAPRDFVIQVTP
jgi:hypothetical protein